MVTNSKNFRLPPFLPIEAPLPCGSSPNPVLSADSLSHDLKFCSISPCDHPDDTFSKKVRLWQTLAAAPMQALQLVSRHPFTPDQARHKLTQVEAQQFWTTKNLGELDKLERPTIQALALASTLNKHRRSPVRTSSLDWLQLETPRTRQLQLHNTQPKEAWQRLVNPQSPGELRSAIEPTAQKISRLSAALDWLTTPLTIIAALDVKKKFPEKTVVTLPPDTKLCMERTFQGLVAQQGSLLGKGSFGTVHTTSFGTSTYAVKSAAGGVHSDTCLQTETATLMSLKPHPHIVPIKAVNSHGLFLEQINGGTMHSQLSNPALTRQEIASYLLNIASAVHSVHEQGFNYKDLKPDNVLINTAKHTAVICDFGLTRATEKDWIEAGPNYSRAPELYLAPTGHLLSAEVDSWSFGVLLFRLITGGAYPFPPRVIQEEPRLFESRTAFLARLFQECYMKPCSPNIFSKNLSKAANEFIAARDIASVSSSPMSGFYQWFQKKPRIGILQTLVIACLHGDPTKRPNMLEIQAILRQYEASIQETS